VAGSRARTWAEVTGHTGPETVTIRDRAGLFFF